MALPAPGPEMLPVMDVVVLSTEAQPEPVHGLGLGGFNGSFLGVAFKVGAVGGPTGTIFGLK